MGKVSPPRRASVEHIPRDRLPKTESEMQRRTAWFFAPREILHALVARELCLQRSKYVFAADSTEETATHG